MPIEHKADNVAYQLSSYWDFEMTTIFVFMLNSGVGPCSNKFCSTNRALYSNPPNSIKSCQKQNCGSNTSVKLLPWGKVSLPVSGLQLCCVLCTEKKFKRGLLNEPIKEAFQEQNFNSEDMKIRVEGNVLALVWRFSIEGGGRWVRWALIQAQMNNN